MEESIRRAREIFIREALVEGHYQTRAAFAQHSRALIEQVQDLEHRARRRDILVDPEETLSLLRRTHSA